MGKAKKGRVPTYAYILFCWDSEGKGPYIHETYFVQEHARTVLARLRKNRQYDQQRIYRYRNDAVAYADRGLSAQTRSALHMAADALRCTDGRQSSSRDMATRPGGSPGALLPCRCCPCAAYAALLNLLTIDDVQRSTREESNGLRSGS
jgi:hypothetical protein